MLTGSLLGFHRQVHADAVEAAPSNPKLALIVDDFGFSRQMACQFLELQIPITFSILPRLPCSLSIAQTIHAQGHELMLHQPMEPIRTHIDPGPGAVFIGDSDIQITSTIGDNINSLPHISGINNHMGSRFTQDSYKMSKALGIVRQKGLYFVDSLTTRHSKAFDTAQHLQIATRKRDLFIDAAAHTETIFKQLVRLKRRATLFGTAIGIGHPYPETLTALQRFVQGNYQQGVAMVYASDLMTSQRT